MQQDIRPLLAKLDASTCNFLAVKTIEDELKANHFHELKQTETWEGKIHPGGCYYMKKNDSAVFAFTVGLGHPAETGLRIISAHSDSPCLKLKPNPEITGDGGLVSLNVEKYGGMILYTWFDRPLSMSGRVMVDSGDPLHPATLLFDLKKPVATIPHLAIHFNRGVNEGNTLSVQKDMKPVLGVFTPEEIENAKAKGGLVRCLVAEHLGIDPAEILDSEICLYPFEKAETVGARGELFQSARIDDLSMAFAAVEALLEGNGYHCPPAHTNMVAIFDNEETGSGTKQGAHSPVIRDIFARLAGEGENLGRAVANSFMISADDAHAWHPNYNEKYDPTNHPQVGGGPVVKINANCKYMTDADGAAVFRSLCREAGVECQYFVNHADVAGGSTLGNILTGTLDLRGVDMGNAIWAMHSARETASVADHFSTVKVFTEFFSRR